MKTSKPTTLAAIALGLLASISSTHAQTLVYDEEFDSTGNGYNIDASTAIIGDDDWVDFGNRVTTDFNGNEGYFTADSGSETVLAGRSNSGDLQIRTDFAPGITKDEVGRIEIRARIDIDQNDAYDDTLVASSLSLFWGTDTYVVPGAQNGNSNVSNNSLGTADQVIAESDGWHLFVWIDNGGLSGGSGNTVNSWRLDAVNGNSGSSFEVDYFKVEESTLIQIDPVDPIPAEFTLREEWNWNTNGAAEGWTPTANGHFTISGVSGGLLTGISDGGGDPGLNSPSFEVLDVTSGRFIIEIGILADSGDTAEKQLFWKLNGGGVSATQSIKIPAGSVPANDALHVIRLNLEDVINNRITGLRYDPSNAMNITSNIDYIRIYSEGPEIPYFPPPVVELDPAPLGPEFIEQQVWDWDIVDDLDGWSTADMEFSNPNDSFSGVFDSAIFGEAIGTDPKITSSAFSVNPPASQQFVVEIDFDDLGAPDTGGQLFWIDDNVGFLGTRSVVTPNVPFDESPHTVRVTFTNNIEGALRQLRFDPTNIDQRYFGIDAVRIYTNGEPVTPEAPRITSFSYDSTTGDAEVVLLGNASTVYSFVRAADLDFSASSSITLTGATIGTLSGGGVETNGSGNATVQFNLGTSPMNFLRAED